MNKVETKMMRIGDDGASAAAADASDKSFAAFLRSPQGQAACGGTDLVARLSPAAANITTQHTLLRWAQERFPDQYPAQNWRAPPPISAAPYGSTAVKGIWARYLAWKEVT